MAVQRPPTPVSTESAVRDARKMLDAALLGGDGSTRERTKVTVSSACAPIRFLSVVEGALHAVPKPGWVWPSNHDELVGTVVVREADRSVTLVGWWTWHVATGTLRLDLACATIVAGPLTVALQDDDAAAALLT